MCLFARSEEGFCRRNATSKEISDLEGELLSIRNLLSSLAALIHNLAEGVHVESLSKDSEYSTEDNITKIDDQEPSKLENG